MRFSSKALCGEHLRSFKNALHPKMKDTKRITRYGVHKKSIRRFPERSQQSYILLRKVRKNIYIYTHRNVLPERLFED